MKVGKEILTFGDIEIEKNKFYHNKESNRLEISATKILGD